MKRFLRETWELWYWAMFCPAKLQKRMNEWSSKRERNEYIKEDIQALEILLFRPNSRFVTQYFLACLLLTFPCFTTIISGHPYYLALTIISIISAFCIGLYSLPVGLGVPILWLIFCLQPNMLSRLMSSISSELYSLTLSVAPDFFDKNIVAAIADLILVGFSTAGVWLALVGLLLAFIWPLTVFFVANFRDYYWVFLVFILGIPAVLGYAFYIPFLLTLCTMMGSSLNSAALIALVGIFIGISILARTVKLNALYSIAGVLVGAAVGMVVTTISILAALDLLPFLLAAVLLAICLAPVQRWWLGLVTALFLTILGFEHLGLSAALAIPVVLLGYYRIFPDYLLLAPISSLFSSQFSKAAGSAKLIKFVEQLPHLTELLQLPLVGHDRLLATAFRIDASKASQTLQKMQSLRSPGFQRTVELALPQLVANRLVAVQTIQDLVVIGQQENPSLQLMSNAKLPAGTNLPQETSEMRLMHSYFRRVAEDLEAGLGAESAALRERSLERIFKALVDLNPQLSDLVSSKQEIKCWQAVIKRWSDVIQLEMAAQQTQSSFRV
jgi:hypothetical protein